MKLLSFLLYAIFVALVAALFGALFTNLAFAKMVAQKNTHKGVLELIAISGNEDHVRLFLKVRYGNNLSYQISKTPPLLSLEFNQKIENALKTPVKFQGLIFGMDIKALSNSKSQILFKSHQPFVVETFKNWQKTDYSYYTIVLRKTAELDLATDAKADNLVKLKAVEKIGDNKNVRPFETISPFRVVIDPGHGGVDTGARGISNIYEKDVTLDFAKKLKAYLEQISNIQVRLTRNEDIFLKLSDRVEIARQWNANLFISIHADTIDSPTIRGTTIYTISNKASDEIAEKLAENQNKVDLIGNINLGNQSEVKAILFDLLRRETYLFSLNFANQFIKDLKKDHMILSKNAHRFADFQVLKAPDVPSVLVELGYLSNREDEKLVRDPSWRTKMASSFAKAIIAFAKNH